MPKTTKNTVGEKSGGDKVKSIDVILRNLEKSMGNTGDDLVIEKAPSIKDVSSKKPVISFGYPEVDVASGCGGVPRGKMIEIFGPESGGKSFLTLKLIGSAQKQGIKCCLVDAENSYDPFWADQNGVDTEDLFIICKPLSAEKTLDYVSKMCESGAFGLVVVDSTAALVPQKELDGSIGDQDYALLARAMSKACRKIVQNCAKTDTTCVFINQIRDKMNVMFGESSTTPGGRALKFYCHQRIKVTPGTKVKVQEGDSEKIIARQSYVLFIKNKAASPFGQCQIEIVFDQTAKNPLVKLCKEAKNYKIISLREGTFRINKSLFEDAKKNVDTETKTTVELADYIQKMNLVDVIMDAYINEIKNEHGEDGLKKVDPDILSIMENPESIVSPMEDAIVEDGEESEDIE